MWLIGFVIVKNILILLKYDRINCKGNIKYPQKQNKIKTASFSRPEMHYNSGPGTCTGKSGIQKKTEVISVNRLLV